MCTAGSTSIAAVGGVGGMGVAESGMVRVSDGGRRGTPAGRCIVSVAGMSQVLQIAGPQRTKCVRVSANKRWGIHAETARDPMLLHLVVSQSAPLLRTPRACNESCRYRGQAPHERTNFDQDTLAAAVFADLRESL